MAAWNVIARWRKPTVSALLSAQLVTAVCQADAAPTLNRDALARCAAEAADDRRLACYDALAGRAGAPSTSTGPPASEAQPSSAGQEKSFGLNKPLEPVNRGPDSIRATVAAISTDSMGNVIVQLDNDQAWTFTDANVLLRKGDTVVVKRAALGSFMMTTPSKRAYHVHRIK